MEQKYLVYLGADFNYPVYGIYQYLPLNLRKYGNVVCIEYPQFRKIFEIIKNKLKYIEKISSKLTVVHSFGLLPFGRKFSWINKINHLFNQLLINLYLNPFNQNDRHTIISLTPEISLIKSTIPDRVPIFYYVIDDYLACPIWQGDLAIKQFLMLERKTLTIAKKVITSSITLYDKYKKHHQNVKYFPNPSNSQPFINYISNYKHSPSDVKEVEKPIIGFIGSLYSWRIDVKLLNDLVSSFKNLSYVFIGDIKKQDKSFFRNFFSRANCYFLGLKNFSQLPKYASSFDVCIVPYKLGQYSEACFPTKIFEYLALGKPVVTTALPAIKHLYDQKLIYWARNKKEFKDYIIQALNERPSQLIIKKRKENAYQNSWEERIQEFVRIISD